MMFRSRVIGVAVLAVVASGVFQQKKKKKPASPLPSVSKVLAHPKNVLTKMSTSIEQLSRNLQEIQNQNSEAVSAEKGKFEEKLRIQKQETDEVIHHNQQLNASIQKLQ